MIGFTLLLSTCIERVKEIHLPEESKKKLFVFSIISPEDNYIKVHVRRIRPYFNSKTSGSDVITGAQVILSDGTNNVALRYNSFVPNNPDRSYYSVSGKEFEIVPGRNYSLSVTTPEGLVAQATCTVPDDLRKINILQQPQHTDSVETIFPYMLSLKTGTPCQLYSFNAELEYTIIKNGSDSISNRWWYAMGYFINPVLTNGVLMVNYANYKEKNWNSSDELHFRKISCRSYDENIYNLYLDNWKDQPYYKLFLNENKIILDPGIFNLNTIVGQTIVPSTSIIPGSVTVFADSNPLVEDKDYIIDYKSGRVRITNRNMLKSGQNIRVEVAGNVTSNRNDNNHQSDTTGIPTQELFFSEPENKFSNIEGGVGLFGAYNISELLVQ